MSYNWKTKILGGQIHRSYLYAMIDIILKRNYSYKQGRPLGDRKRITSHVCFVHKEVCKMYVLANTTILLQLL